MPDDVAALIRDAVRSTSDLPGPFMTSAFAEPVAVEMRDGDLWLRPPMDDEVEDLLTSVIAEKAWKRRTAAGARAMELVCAIAPSLVWLRDHKDVRLTIDNMRFSTELRWIRKLALEKIALLRDPIDGAEAELDVNGDMPEDVIERLRDYLALLRGCNPELPFDRQTNDAPDKRHARVLPEIEAMFAELAVPPRKRPRGHPNTRSFRMLFCDPHVLGCSRIELVNPRG